MRQIQFALEDIKRKKAFYLRFFVQITCVLILFGSCVSQFISLNEFTHKFDIFADLSELYIVRDNTDEDLINERLSSNDIQDKLIKFYHYLVTSHDFKFYTYLSRDLIIENNENLKINYTMYPDKSKRYSHISVDNNFIQTFGLSTIKGRNFVEDDFKSRKNLTPVILGYDYKKFYKVGDTIDDTYNVVGILNKNAFYLAPGKTGEIIYLNNFIISPLIVNNDTSFAELDSIITSSTLITKSPSSLQEIKDMSKSIGLYEKLNFISFSQQLDNIIKSCMTQIYFLALIQTMILFFCLTCIITSFINYIDSHHKELAIHILCGARNNDLIYRIAFQIFSLFVFANLITLFIYKFSLSTLSIVALSVLILLAIIIFPAIKIKKQHLPDYLRSE